MERTGSCCTVLVMLAAMAISGTQCEEEKIQLPANLKEISDQIKSSSEKIDWTPGIGDWVPPEEMTKSLRYYVAGYDYSHRPVMMWEAGHWDVKKWTSDPATKDDFYKYTEQFWFKLQNLKSPFEDAEEGVVLLMDMDGFAASQLASVETIKLHLWSLRIGEKLENTIVDYILMNLNFVGQTWVNIIRPIAGKLIGKSESYGPKKELWFPVLTSVVCPRTKNGAPGRGRVLRYLTKHMKTCFESSANLQVPGMHLLPRV